MKGFTNSLVYLNGGFYKKAVGIENGRIAYIGDDYSAITESLDKADCESYLVPGFIDEHIHGAGGSDAMDGTEKALKTISDTLVKEGTTSFLFTTMTASPEKTKASLAAADGFIGKYNKQEENGTVTGARPLGVHLEGPFVNPLKCGAQPEEFILEPKICYLKDFFVKDGLVKMITVAPELTDDGFIQYLKDKGITVSAGHTNATFEEFSASVKEGVSCTTHTYNAMRAFTHRETGVIGGAFLTNVYNELIADGIHVSYPAIRILFGMKSDKVILITDAMRAKGLSDGESELGGQKVFVKNGEARLSDGTLAGSVLKMNVAIKNLVLKAGVPLETVIKSATENPAKNLKIFENTGSIEIGKNADLTLLSKNFDVLSVMIGGKNVYKA